MALDPASFTAGLVVGAVLGAFALLFLRIPTVWLQAITSGVALPILYLIGMRFRGSPATLVVEAHVALAKRGRPTTNDVVEAVYLANRSRVRNEQDPVALVEAALPEGGERLNKGLLLPRRLRRDFSNTSR
jgi:uncharacterized protein YqfA (UPF0365 family)